MEFEWDETKAAQNLEKHGVSFEDVRRFRFESAIRRLDRRFDYGEDRYLSIGFVGDRLHILVYTDRDDAVRVISLRRANPRERALYDDEKTSTT